MLDILHWLRRRLLVEPAWKIRLELVANLPEHGAVDWDAGLWRATIRLRAGLSPEEYDEVLRHELIELTMWEEAEFVEDLIATYVPSGQQAAALRRRHLNVRNRLVEKFVQLTASVDDGSERQQDSDPRLRPPSLPEWPA